MKSIFELFRIGNDWMGMTLRERVLGDCEGYEQGTSWGVNRYVGNPKYMFMKILPII